MGSVRGSQMSDPQPRHAVFTNDFTSEHVCVALILGPGRKPAEPVGKARETHNCERSAGRRRTALKH